MKSKSEYYDTQKANTIEDEDIKRTIKESLNNQISYRKDTQNLKLDIEINKANYKTIKPELEELERTKKLLRAENERNLTKIETLRLDLNNR